MNPAPDSHLTRRSFLGTSTAAVIGGALASSFPYISRAQDAQKPLKVALVGCGGRGTGAAAQALKADNYAELTAIADVFGDQIEKSLENLRRVAGDKVKVQDSQKFIGLDGIDKVLNTDVDVVLLTTPPGFRPEHFEKCVKAGKHTFCEKPVAADAPGVRRFMAAAEEAKKKNLGVQSGFCCFK